MPAEIFAVVVSVGFSAVVVRAMRRGGLEPRTALVWAGAAVGEIPIALTPPFHLLDEVAHGVGIVYPPDVLLAVAVVWMAVLSVTPSEMRSNQTALAQELGRRTINESSAEGANSP